MPVFGYLLPCPAALALFVDALAFGFAEVPNEEQWQQQQCGKPDGSGGDHVSLRIGLGAGPTGGVGLVRPCCARVLRPRVRCSVGGLSFASGPLPLVGP